MFRSRTEDLRGDVEERGEEKEREKQGEERKKFPKREEEVPSQSTTV